MRSARDRCREGTVDRRSAREQSVRRAVRRSATALFVTAAVMATLGCAPVQPSEPHTPEDVRDAVVDTVTGTRALFPDLGWTMQNSGVPTPGECDANGVKGADFGMSGYTTDVGTDRVADAEKVRNYWQSLGIAVRTVAEPYPAVFGSGGPVKAISFLTAPTYSIDAGGLCAPGNPYDFYDVTPSSLPPGP